MRGEGKRNFSSLTDKFFEIITSRIKPPLPSTVYFTPSLPSKRLSDHSRRPEADLSPAGRNVNSSWARNPALCAIREASECICDWAPAIRSTWAEVYALEFK